jgi:hypothetical protein
MEKDLFKKLNNLFKKVYEKTGIPWADIANHFFDKQYLDIDKVISSLKESVVLIQEIISILEDK